MTDQQDAQRFMETNRRLVHEALDRIARLEGRLRELTHQIDHLKNQLRRDESEQSS